MLVCDNINLDWFAVQCKTNSYLLAKKNLENQGVKTFLPLIEVTQRKSTKFITALKPLFPGYIFVSFNLKNFRWTAINNTIGIIKLITADNIPQCIPSNFISYLKLRCDKDDKLVSGEPKLGKKAKILNGPFSQMIGTVENIDPQKRVTLLFELMGQKTKTLVKGDHITIVS